MSTLKAIGRVTTEPLNKSHPGIRSCDAGVFGVIGSDRCRAEYKGVESDIVNLLFASANQKRFSETEPHS